MVKPRSARSDEFESVVGLINRVFRTTRGHRPTMQQEFPLLINRNNIDNMIIIEKENKVLSDVNYLIQDVLIQGTGLKIASIGAVCTDPEHEGKGYSSRVLDRVEEKMYEDGVEIVLISGTRTLYTRRMCSQVKNFHKYVIKPGEVSLDFSIEEYNENYLHEIILLYNQNSTRYFRTKEQFKVLLESATIPWGTYSYKRLVIKKDNKIIGYVVLRIIDESPRRGEIIEASLPEHCAGELIACLANKYNLDHIDYWVHVKDYNNHIAGYDEISLDYLHGTIKIINYEKLCKSLNRYFTQYVDKELVESLEFKASLDGNYSIKYREEELIIKNLEELNKLFFEGVLINEENLEVKPHIKEFIQSVFPIHFVWPANLNYQ